MEKKPRLLLWNWRMCYTMLSLYGPHLFSLKKKIKKNIGIQMYNNKTPGAKGLFSLGDKGIKRQESVARLKNVIRKNVYIFLTQILNIARDLQWELID